VEDEKRFGTKTLYRFTHRSSDDAPDTIRYEERVTLVMARDFNDALARGEAFANEYAREHDAEYLGFIDAYEISDDIGDGAEVYSITRSSALQPKEFIDRYYDDGTQGSTRATSPEC
jgi:outer membrane protein assembly factor BamD (BamD/ComL family)